MSSNMRKMRRTRSSCVCAKYHLGLCSPFIHSVVSIDSVSGQWRSWSDCMDEQADQGLCCLHMPEDIFSHGAAQLFTIHVLHLNMFYIWTTPAWILIWATTSENLPSGMWIQWRLRSAYASVQSDQNRHWAHFGEPTIQSSFMQTTKILIRLHRCTC